MPPVLDDRDHSCLALLAGQSQWLSGFVDPPVAHPVGDLKGRIADGPGQCAAQGPRLLAIGEIHHQPGGGGAHRAAREEITGECDRRHHDRSVVRPRGDSARVKLGEADRPPRGRGRRRERPRRPAGPRACAARVRERRPSPRRRAHYGGHQRDRRPWRTRDLGDQPVDVSDGDNRHDQRRPGPPARIGEEGMHERAAMGVHERAPGVAREPCSPGERKQRPGTAPRRPRPRRGARHEQGEPRGEIRGRLGKRHASSELKHSPENSALVMNPRAGVACSRLRYAPRPRLEISTTAGADGSAASRSATAKPSIPGSWTSSSTTWGRRRRTCFDSRFAVGGLPEDVEPVGLEERPRTRPEPGVVIHDQDGPGHDAHRPTLAGCLLRQRRAHGVEARTCRRRRTRRGTTAVPPGSRARRRLRTPRVRCSATPS